MGGVFPMMIFFMIKVLTIFFYFYKLKFCKTDLLLFNYSLVEFRTGAVFVQT